MKLALPRYYCGLTVPNVVQVWALAGSIPLQLLLIGLCGLCFSDGHDSWCYRAAWRLGFQLRRGSMRSHL